MAGQRLIFVLGSALSLASGCYQGIEQVQDDLVASRDEHFNAVKLNAIKLNAIKLNAVKLNAVKLNAVKLNAIKLNAIKLNAVKLNGSEFTGLALDGNQEALRRGTEFVGAEFEITITTPNEQGIEVAEDFVLRFDDIYPDPNVDDALLYEMSFRAAGSDTWDSLCEGDAPVIPLNNYWDDETGERIDDPDAVTFACTNAVLAKCVEWGYRPWAEATYCTDKKGKKGKKDKDCDEVSLQDYHQACTRMARADYCGDGTSWTLNGTAIDIADNLSPQLQAPSTDWKIEAEWTPEGASCLNDMRHPELAVDGYPSCFVGKKGKPEKFKGCGDFKKYDGLLRTAANAPCIGKKCK